MQAVTILRHSLRQITGNIGAVLRIWIVPYLIAGLSSAPLLVAGAVSKASGGNVPSGSAILIALAAVVNLFVLCWVATSWHRYVLLGEPVGLIARPHTREIMLYFLQLLLIGLAVVPIVLALILINALLGTQTAPRSLALLWDGLLTIIVTYFALRLGTWLPGVAIGKEKPSLAGWKATAGRDGDITGLVLMLYLLQTAIALIVTAIMGSGDWPPAMLFMIGIAALVVNIAFSVLTLSVTTTLYGHYVEGRPLH